MPRMAAADNEKQHGATGRPRQAKKDRVRREVIEASSSPSGRPQPQILKALRMTQADAPPGCGRGPTRQNIAHGKQSIGGVVNHH